MGNKVKETDRFHSGKGTVVEREMENQDWINRRTMELLVADPEKVFCFVSTALGESCTLLEFEDREAMDLEMGELVKEFEDGQVVEYPEVLI